MSTQHTPGPWHWDGNPCDYDPDQEAPWLVDSNNPYPPILGGTIKCQSEADARLIAAAPDLLEALNTWLNQYSAEEYEDCPEVVQTRAAIAKATGAI